MKAEFEPEGLIRITADTIAEGIAIHHMLTVASKGQPVSSMIVFDMRVASEFLNANPPEETTNEST